MGPNSFVQVAVERHHAGRKERVHHRPREETTQVCLEETQHLGFVGLSGKNRKTNQVNVCQSVGSKLIQQENDSWFSTFGTDTILKSVEYINIHPLNQ